MFIFNTLVTLTTISTALSRLNLINGSLIGPSAAITCEPRQAWKGAAVTIDSGAGVWRMRLSPIILERAVETYYECLL